MKKYIVKLTEEERATLRALISKGTAAARTLTHARILLKADASEDGPGWTDEAIRDAFEVSLRTVERVRQRCVEEGLVAALRPKPASRTRPRKLDGRQEAHLIALVCGDAPEGSARWTLRLLAETMVELGHVESVSHETVRQTLKKTS
jgi:transposase